MLTAEQRKTLVEIGAKLKEDFDPFYRAMIGELRVGGSTGYLGIYDTCAIETEDSDVNSVNHARAMAVTNAIGKIRAPISRFGMGMDYLEGDEDNHWLNAAKNFFENRKLISDFFDEEKSGGKSEYIAKKLAASDDFFNKFDKSAFESITAASDVIAGLDCGRRIKALLEKEMAAKPTVAVLEYSSLLSRPAVAAAAAKY